MDYPAALPLPHTMRVWYKQGLGLSNQQEHGPTWEARLAEEVPFISCGPQPSISKAHGRAAD